MNKTKTAVFSTLALLPLIGYCPRAARDLQSPIPEHPSGAVPVERPPLS